MSRHQPETEFLARLRDYGATKLERVTFRENRSTIWSVTRGGRAINLHAGYRSAPESVVSSLATIAREAGRGSPEVRRAAQIAREWPGIHEALIQARRGQRNPSRTTAGRGSGPCAGTDDQRAYLRQLYTRLNRTRFDGQLPPDLRIRLSSRMTRRLGQMLATGRGPHQQVREIALNLDLMLEANDALRIDTLLHEMAHVAAFLEAGDHGHGPDWKRWAVRVGCRPDRLTDAQLARRPSGLPVTRVPPMAGAPTQTSLFE